MRPEAAKPRISGAGAATARDVIASVHEYRTRTASWVPLGYQLAEKIAAALTAAGYSIVHESDRPALIAAAWKAWHSRHKGSIGPGPAFVEAIDAILAEMRALPDGGVE